MGIVAATRMSIKVMASTQVWVGQRIVAAWYLDRHNQWRLYLVDDLDYVRWETRAVLSSMHTTTTQNRIVADAADLQTWIRGSREVQLFETHRRSVWPILVASG